MASPSACQWSARMCTKRMLIRCASYSRMSSKDSKLKRPYCQYGVSSTAGAACVVSFRLSHLPPPTGVRFSVTCATGFGVPRAEYRDVAVKLVPVYVRALSAHSLESISYAYSMAIRFCRLVSVRIYIYEHSQANITIISSGPREI